MCRTASAIGDQGFCVPSVFQRITICAGIAACGIYVDLAFAADKSSIPNFAPNPSVSWVAVQGGFKPPKSGAGPVQDDPQHPTITNDDFRLTGKQPTWPVADLSNPILQPWVREALRKHNEIVLSGAPGYGPRQSCWLVGTPGFLVAPVFRPIYIVQAPKEVLMTWLLDHQTRHIYMDVPHSAHPKPSYFGESVGHYEGDSLVVDTIGINDKTYIDDYLTPHTDKLHVVERYRMTDNGKTLEVGLHVEDAGAFTMPWDAVQYFKRVEPGVADNTNVIANDLTSGRSSAGPLTEESCAESTLSHLGEGALPVPRAEKADF
jgi:hypothetical protein